MCRTYGARMFQITLTRGFRTRANCSRSTALERGGARKVIALLTGLKNLLPPFEDENH